MATTYYHSTNSVLRGETTSGTSIDYMTDGVSSVIGTVDQTQAVTATFRFNPYGSRLSKVGMGFSPRFGWRSSAIVWTEFIELFSAPIVSVLGYQLTSAFRKAGTFRDGGLGSDVPECGSQAAPWSSITPQDVIIELDLVSASKFRQPYPCWQYWFNTIWRLTEESKKAQVGAVIQNVTFMIDQYNCKDDSQSLRCSLRNYSEAWTVTNGKFDDRVTGEIGARDYQTDAFMMQKYDDCTHGLSFMVGTFAFYGGCKVTENSNGWKTGMGTCNGGPWGQFLLGQWGRPSGFTAGDGQKSLSYKTNCCFEKKGYSFELSYSSKASQPFQFSGGEPASGKEVCKGTC